MADEIRALTVKQPWAHAIAHMGKLVENRSWCPVRTRLLAIHAGARSGWDADGEMSPLLQRAWREWIKTLPADNLPTPYAEPGAIHIDFGAVIAVADLTGYHDATYAEGCSCSPWAAPHSWHWELANVRPLTHPVACRGNLGLWHLPPGVEVNVRAQLEATTDA